MIRASAPAVSGDIMGTTLTIAEALRIEALLSRLEPDQGGTCRVAGCLHLHLGPTGREDVPALAA
jgi:hypothetical protein